MRRLRLAEEECTYVCVFGEKKCRAPREPSALCARVRALSVCCTGHRRLGCVVCRRARSHIYFVYLRSRFLNLRRQPSVSAATASTATATAMATAIATTRATAVSAPTTFAAMCVSRSRAKTGRWRCPDACGQAVAGVFGRSRDQASPTSSRHGSATATRTTSPQLGAAVHRCAPLAGDATGRTCPLTEPACASSIARPSRPRRVGRPQWTDWRRE